MSKSHSFALALALCASSLFADRVITDQLGRDVTLPDEVKRIVVLQHQSLNALNELNALDKVVGVQESWEKSLGKNYVRLAPSLKDMPTPGDLKVINYEAVLKLKPDIVIVTNYIPQEYIDKMTELKIPVVAVSFQRSDAADKSKLNPTFKDDEAAYTEGFYDGIELLGKVANREKEAAELKSNPQLANLSAVKEDKIYMMPEYAKAWSYPTAEAMALGEWWLAMKLYPKHFDEAEFNKKVEEFYQKFYRTSYK
ncbi:ABC transporter substrate-binding protein [uncultured Campylobacter sp.]|uniref:ABC transporter substrate-binding protein n=1 Tax=uncultured Campylobacter sp. TaxID=218934 RepID=UPI00261E6688|nr:ABC transporter substrate-binding protein [uncultured Campylobacter sp.]